MQLAIERSILLPQSRGFEALRSSFARVVKIGEEINSRHGLDLIDRNNM
jgi:hypothetical protein